MSACRDETCKARTRAVLRTREFVRQFVHVFVPVRANRNQLCCDPQNQIKLAPFFVADRVELTSARTFEHMEA